MPQLTFDDDVEVWRNIDAEIIKHATAIVNLKTRRNAHTNTVRLPPELLSQIFLHTKWQAEADPQPASFHIHTILEREWLTLAQVCHHWRKIALDTPQLWSTINLSVVDCAVEWLKRSKSAPLLLRSTKPLNISQCRAAVEAVISDIERVHDINVVFGTPSSMTKFFGLNRDSCAPTLKTLRCLITNPTSRVPNLIIWRDMPALCSLEFLNLRLDPNFPVPILPQLTKLVIKSLPSQGLSISWLARFLKRTPDIVEIDVGPLLPYNDIVDDVRIRLSKLSSLCLEATDIGVSKFFDIIDYPESTHVEYTQATLALGPNIDLSSLQRVCSRVAAKTDADYRIKISIYDDFFVHISSPSSTGTDLRITLPTPSGQHDDYIRLCSALPLSMTLSLIMNEFDDSIPSEQWIALFPSFTRLKTLHLYGCDTVILDGLLAAKDDDPPPLPKLESIVLESCFCTYPNDPTKSMPKILVQVLEDRRQRDKPIQSLTLLSSSISPADVEQLRQVVDVTLDCTDL